MQRTGTKRIFQVSTTLVCCIAISHPALAAPPAKTLLPAAQNSRSSHLDLRLPTNADSTGLKALTGETRRGLPIRDDSFSGDYRHAFPALESEARQPVIVGRAEAMAQRFRHEGLPVARLWENHAAFVSLGLNGRGKPGIWLVQKTH